MVEYDRIMREFGTTLAAAFDTLKIEPEQADKFQFAIRRKGKTKALVDETDLPGSASYGVYTFVANEANALHFKLLLGDNFDRMWRLR
jgi:hypothetical protein